MQLRTALRVALPIVIIVALTFFFLKSPFAKGDPNYTETTSYFLTDHLGSVDVVMDDQGKVVERADYLPYGDDRLRTTSPSISPSTSPSTDYKFTGKELDGETGLMYYGARYYDPAVGRFISFDPLLLNEGGKPLSSVLMNPQALNPYSYVTNNPTRFVDETGEYKVDVHYNLTYYLGLKAGLDDATAIKIAWFDNMVDINPDTKPDNLENAKNGTTDKFHFAERGEAITRLENAINSNDAKTFGTSLHTYQDTYSHAGLTKGEHVWLSKAEEYGWKEGSDPDKTVNDVTKATMMSFKTFQYIRAFQKVQLGLTDKKAIAEFNSQTNDIWVNIHSDVNEFLSSKDKTETAVQKHISGEKETD